MERIKGLDRYQKGILLFMAVMVLVFTVAYSITTTRIGFSYRDTILTVRRGTWETLYILVKTKGSRRSLRI